MTKHCETFEHTADVGLAARADSLGELMEALGEGLADLICPREQVRQAQERAVAVRAEDVEALAVDFLVEVMNLLQADHFAVASVRAVEASAGTMRAVVSGEPVDPERHYFEHEVKAVTYHRLRVAQEGGQWVAQVILDL